MLSTQIQKIGDWNPQLFREIKGRFKTRNIVLATGISLFGQLLLLMYHFTQLPVLNPLDKYYLNRYCTGNNRSSYSGASCFILNGNFVIDWQQWWLDIFLWLSFLGMFALLTAGTFMLIGDLERKKNGEHLTLSALVPSLPKAFFWANS